MDGVPVFIAVVIDGFPENVHLGMVLIGGGCRWTGRSGIAANNFPEAVVGTWR